MVESAALPSLAAGTVLPLHLAAAPSFPGAFLIVAADGSAAVTDAGRSALVDTLIAEGTWPTIIAAAAEAAARATPSIELFGLGGGSGPVEATFLPSTDGRALVLLRPFDFGSALHRSLAESRQRYKDLVEAISDFAWETDRDARFRFVSPRGALGWAAQELVGRPVSAFIAGTDGSGQVPEAFRARVPVQDEDVWFRRPLGPSECLSVIAVPLYDATGQWQGSRGLCRRVTEQRRLDRDRAQQSLLAQLTAHLARTMQSEIDPERALGAALSAVGLAVSATGGAVLRDEDGAPVEIVGWGDDKREAIIGVTRGLAAIDAAIELFDQDCHLLVCPTRFQSQRNGLVLVWRERERGPFTGDDCAILDRAADPFGAAIARFVDYQGALRRSRTDPLTGLLNRRAFLDEAARRIQRLRRTGTGACLIFVDLDNFKLVNDRHGHRGGDELLTQVCGILEEHSRSGDMLARLGGDEFVLWLDGVAAPAAIERAQAIIARCAALGHLSGDPARPLGTSLGLAIFDPATAESLDELILRADRAMYAAKRDGKAGFTLAPAAEQESVR
jgi:diguanylate cyclase (GGDEF)-like protein/PAS domain S-box-containing protein